MRIYERGSFDSFCPMTPEKINESVLAFIYLEGQHVNQAGKTVTDMAAGEPFSEAITGGEILYGGKVSDTVKRFVTVLCHGYQAGFD